MSVTALAGRRRYLLSLGGLRNNDVIKHSALLGLASEDSRVKFPTLIGY